MKFTSIIQKSLLTILIFSFASNKYLSAQEKDSKTPVYAVVTCLKAKNNKAEAMLKNMALPYHKAAVKEKQELSWQYYEVEFPNGDDCNCNYMMVSIINSLQNLEFFIHPGPKVNMAKTAFPGQNPEKLINKWNETFESKGVQVYVLMDDIVGGNVPADYISVNYMDVKEINARKYIEMETSIFKPLHQEAVKNGYMKDWSLFRRILPYGADFEGNFVTVDAWGSIENLENSMNGSGDLFQKVHPKKDINQLMKKMTNTRQLHRSELWRYGLGTNR